MNSADPQPDYWTQYGAFQQVKHDLIRHYLNGWFPKLGTWAGRVWYVDTHAGRGRHRSGEIGSPLVALKTLLDHSYRDKLLQKSEVRYLFIERDNENLARLKAELNAIGDLPSGIRVDTRGGDSYAVLSKIIDMLEASGHAMAPAFVFVDPYGFKVPWRLLARLMAAGRVELFVNVIWRELGMAVQQRPSPGHGLAKTLDDIFAGSDWRRLGGDDALERMHDAAELISNLVGAKWDTRIRMTTGGSAIRYILLHLTNHDQGRDLMKECAWKVAPDGSFEVLQRDDPKQPLLVTPSPDLTSLRTWVVELLRQQPRSREDLRNALRSELWLPTHLNQVVRKLLARREIEEDGAGNLSPAAQRLLW